jgi:hypothetical protein
MMRWVMVAVSLLGFSLSFGTTSVALLAFGLLLGFGGLFGAVLAFAAARVESVSQGQSSRELSIILEARKRKALAQNRPADGGGVEISLAGAGTGGRSKAATADERTPDGAASDGGGDGGGGGD